MGNGVLPRYVVKCRASKALDITQIATPARPTQPNCAHMIRLIIPRGAEGMTLMATKSLGRPLLVASSKAARRFLPPRDLRLSAKLPSLTEPSAHPQPAIPSRPAAFKPSGWSLSSIWFYADDRQSEIGRRHGWG